MFTSIKLVIPWSYIKINIYYFMNVFPPINISALTDIVLLIRENWDIC